MTTISERLHGYKESCLLHVALLVHATQADLGLLPQARSSLRILKKSRCLTKQTSKGGPYTCRANSRSANIYSSQSSMHTWLIQACMCFQWEEGGKLQPDSSSGSLYPMRTKNPSIPSTSAFGGRVGTLTYGLDGRQIQPMLI